MPDDAPQSNPKSLTRRNMEAVIRRAVELSLEESDSSDNISEDEVIRIAGELGISPRHVKQAMFENRGEEREESYLDRWMGPDSVTATRVVPCPERTAHGRLEDHLVTREYLQIRRKQGNHAYFEPADDAFSSIARTFSRPSSKFHLARAHKAFLTIRAVDEQSCHVRLELNYADRRKSQADGAIYGGGMAAILIGGLAGIATGNLMGGPDIIQAIGGMTAGVVAGGGVFAGIWAAVRNEYRKWINRTQDEADSLLDRLEHGDSLRPPASPWLRRLQQKLRG